jgi:hypothetical protein
MAEPDRPQSPFAGMADFSARAPLRVLSPDDIERMLAEHRLYLETEYHEGHRANFSSADLTGRGFSGLNLRGIKMDRALLSGATSMRIHNLYTDASGQSHFRDIEVEWVEERRGSKLSKRLPANGIIFRETQAEHDIGWHPAPRRQYIINLDAGVKITASDGESRVIGVGEVILVEDTTGKGHLSQHVEGKIRHSIFVPID